MNATYPSLAGKRVLITGGASGIGAEHVRAFVGQGSKVVFLDIDDAAAATAPPEATYRHCDLTDIASLRATIDELGPFDVLVNNAARDDRHAMETVEPELWHRTMALNLDHQFFATQRVAPAMAAAGCGAIILTGSISWMRGIPGMVGYTTAKAAIGGLARTLARELGPQGVRVNAIVPGAVRTERQVRLWRKPGDDERFLQNQALKFHLDGTHIARAALFLASEEAAGITGISLVVDAGVTLN
jgi:NAD(P)-dependent dehydrogenase (short-subunit alcohol dehydrogenase family)